MQGISTNLTTSTACAAQINLFSECRTTNQKADSYEYCNTCKSNYDQVSSTCTGDDAKNPTVKGLLLQCYKEGDKFCAQTILESSTSTAADFTCNYCIGNYLVTIYDTLPASEQTKKNDDPSFTKQKECIQKTKEEGSKSSSSIQYFGLSGVLVVMSWI